MHSARMKTGHDYVNERTHSVSVVEREKNFAVREMRGYSMSMPSHKHQSAANKIREKIDCYVIMNREWGM